MTRPVNYLARRLRTLALYLVMTWCVLTRRANPTAQALARLSGHAEDPPA
jgi:hypothetical protein